VGREWAARPASGDPSRRRRGRRETGWRSLGLQATGPQKGRRVSYSFHFFYIFFKTIFKMDFESKSNKIKTTPHNKSNATT
jgi:hypothetical protein